MFLERPTHIRKASAQISRRVAKRVGHERHGHHAAPQLVEIAGQLGPAAAAKQRIRADRIALICAGDWPLLQPAATVRQLEGLAQIDQGRRILAATVTAHAAPALERRTASTKNSSSSTAGAGFENKTPQRSRIRARSDSRSSRSLANRTARST